MSDTRSNPIKALSAEGSVPSAKACSVTEKSNKEICSSVRGLEGTQTIDCCHPPLPSRSFLHSRDAWTSYFWRNLMTMTQAAHVHLLWHRPSSAISSSYCHSSNTETLFIDIEEILSGGVTWKGQNGSVSVYGFVCWWVLFVIWHLFSGNL